MNKFKEYLPLIITPAIVATLLLIWIGCYIFQTNIPPKGIKPGDTVYFISDYIAVKDGQMCKTYSTMVVAPFGPDDQKWWNSIGGFGYMVYLTEPDGGFIYGRALGDFKTTLPDICSPATK